MDIKPWAGSRASHQRARNRISDAAATPHRRSLSAWGWQIVASAAVLAIMGGLAALLAAGQADTRAGLEERFHTRIDLTARFAAEYDADVLRREASVGLRALGGANPTRAEFEAVVADFGFEAALLLDKDGRVLQVFPSKPALIGMQISAKYPHLAQALSGNPAISNVVASAVQAIPVVAFATPYDTAYGRRVLSGAYDVSTTPLAAQLRNALPFVGGEVYLVDGAGSLVASNMPTTRTVRTLDVIEPALPETEQGQYLRAGQSRWYAATPVPGSSLRLVASVPESDLFGPINGTTVWLPWVIVLALTMASLYTVRVLFALHRSREDYLSLARIDPLTGISNRRELSAMTQGLLADARRRKEPLAVLMLDLDRFKSVNDTRGHEGGDEVLRVVSARMRNALRASDLLGRWGGEEFVAILPATSVAQAVIIAERVRAAISGTPISLVRGAPVIITASVGCAVTVDESADDVIGRADQAMYLAKQSGDTVVAAPEPVKAEDPQSAVASGLSVVLATLPGVVHPSTAPAASQPSVG